jgi:hypothetical protein
MLITMDEINLVHNFSFVKKTKGVSNQLITILKRNKWDNLKPPLKSTEKKNSKDQ